MAQRDTAEIPDLKEGAEDIKTLIKDVLQDLDNNRENISKKKSKKMPSKERRVPNSSDSNSKNHETSEENKGSLHLASRPPAHKRYDEKFPVKIPMSKKSNGSDKSKENNSIMLISRMSSSIADADITKLLNNEESESPTKRKRIMSYNDNKANEEFNMNEVIENGSKDSEFGIQRASTDIQHEILCNKVPGEDGK